MFARMAVTLSNIRTKITAVEQAISRVEVAIQYNDGDVSAQRVELKSLEERLSRLRADEAQLEAAANGGRRSPIGIITPKYSS